ncbi:hypothetical protein SAMN04489859_103024 [Paracoccus alcaliphilus]|uniref:Peptidase propeptide and YPEB domain-containing protein n=1 Tax=Paracoccus alcaliphilus TaxID=34002 RepID=A0A1H8LFA6_9RHOB|nr:hypothetical protein [Paracoccus alcaliphilus]WCR18526.1 hypothetical protein JHW40_01825 [Paracoccus alcaliphilus]SEO03805.1 hypothetical protein SAMN04489859_103024 [Paracoccus alcaliphilus]
MSRIRLTTSAAIIALAGAWGGVALAQDATDIPDWLQQMDLQNVQTETKRHGAREIEGRLPGGGKIEALFDRDGKLIEIEADDAALPQPALDAILSDAIRSHEAMGLFSRVHEISVKREKTEIEGYQQNGNDLELEFDPEGRLIAIDADDTPLPQSLIDALLPQAVRDSDALAQFATIDEIKQHGETRFRIEGEDEAGHDIAVMVDQDGRMLRFGRDGGDRKGGWGERGFHNKDPRGHARTMRGENPHRETRRDQRARAPELSFDPVELNQRLTESGYSAFGLLRHDGRRLTLDAQNPAGEAVTLELDPAGEVLRETAR